MKLHQPRTKIGNVKRLRHSHHQVAVLDAMGKTTAEIVELTGYSETRIGTLRLDPAYQMLVTQKREKVEELEMNAYADSLKQKERIMRMADRHIEDAFAEADEAGELVPLARALAISADMADRIGLGKHSSRTNVNVDLAAEMEEALRRSSKATEVRGTVVEMPKLARRV